ncbi:HEPN domain-containing protein [uncultured Ferrimonas sp.]|uniref:HEPN domain-containing protein n=1 Tax=uncultured Ferrimonas sp. TaxID=432640 RepID=UPI002638697D|nr:HEPN domain-containing protein [uncultured Ferrimonas sp.]
MSPFQRLKARQRQERHHYHDSIGLRVHRALSWLEQAEQSRDDDARFLFLWIAFNSAYAQEQEQDHRLAERNLYQQFLQKLVDLDDHHRLADVVWQHYASAIRCILDNQFILPEYWQFQRGEIDEPQWKCALNSAKAAANRALASNDTAKVLAIVFQRLYTLRNQMIHGGATYGSSANRAQLADCTAVLTQLVPLIIELMMDNHNALWGDAIYPLVPA